MILEHVVLHVVPGEARAFEQAFAQAKGLVAGMPGFRKSATRSVAFETPNRCLLLMVWEQLEDHTEGFRDSPEYERWRALLHHFYDPFPDVAHYERVADA